MPLTLLHKHIKFAGRMCIEILASKFLLVMRTYRMQCNYIAHDAVYSGPPYITIRCVFLLNFCFQFSYRRMNGVHGWKSIHPSSLMMMKAMFIGLSCPSFTTSSVNFAAQYVSESHDLSWAKGSSHGTINSLKLAEERSTGEAALYRWDFNVIDWYDMLAFMQIWLESLRWIRRVQTWSSNASLTHSIRFFIQVTSWTRIQTIRYRVLYYRPTWFQPGTVFRRYDSLLIAGRTLIIMLCRCDLRRPLSHLDVSHCITYFSVRIVLCPIHSSSYCMKWNKTCIERIKTFYDGEAQQR